MIINTTTVKQTIAVYFYFKAEIDFHKCSGDSYAVVFTKVMSICQSMPFLAFYVVNEKVCGMTPCS